MSLEAVNTEVLALHELADCPFAANLIGRTEDAETVHLVRICVAVYDALLYMGVAVC